MSVKVQLRIPQKMKRENHQTADIQSKHIWMCQKEPYPPPIPSCPSPHNHGEGFDAPPTL